MKKTLLRILWYKVWNSCLPLIFWRHDLARPELRGYKVSSKSAEQSHSYNIPQSQNFKFGTWKNDLITRLTKEKAIIFWSLSLLSEAVLVLHFDQKTLSIEHKMKLALSSMTSWTRQNLYGNSCWFSIYRFSWLLQQKIIACIDSD